MLLELLFFIGLQLTFFFVFSIPGLIGFFRTQKMQKQALASINDNMPKLTTYMNYMAQRDTIQRRTIGISTRQLSIIVFLILLGFTILLPKRPDSSLFFFPSLLSPGVTLIDFISSLIALLLPIIFAPSLGFLLGITITNLFGNLLLDAEVIRACQISTLSTQEIRKQCIQLTLNTLVSPIIILETCTLIATFTQQTPPILIALCVLITTQVLIQFFFHDRIQRAITQAQPIEQTEWAYLLPRIQAWCRLANIQFKNIYVQRDCIGTNIYLRGLNPNMIIGDTLLRFMDWRQLDTMLCMEVVMVKTRLTHKIAINGIIAMINIFVLAGCVATTVYIIISMDLNLLPIDIISCIMVAIFTLINWYLNKKNHTAYLNADCIAAYFTGDPMALMVALHTISAINGVKLTQIATNIPTAMNRLQQLDRLAQQPWPRAPYAAELVPAVIPVIFNNYQLSKAFSDQSQPAPVPEAAYVQLK